MKLQVGAAGWGEARLPFSLAAFDFVFEGLSDWQREALCRLYPAFVRTGSCNPRTSPHHCHIRKLPAPPRVSAADLTRDDLYAMRCRWNGRQYALTGINFEAEISLDPGSASTLGVAREHELAQANVIENFLRVFSAHHALRKGGLMLHSAGLVFDGRAWIFPGYSNAGKTTLTRKAYAVGARVLSDDINLLLPASTAFSAHAVPFTGEFGRGLEHEGGGEWPVAAMVLLEQGERLEATAIAPAAAVARLLAACPFVNQDARESEILFDNVVSVIERLPVIRLRCRRDDPVDAIMSAVHARVSLPNNDGSPS